MSCLLRIKVSVAALQLHREEWGGNLSSACPLLPFPPLPITAVGTNRATLFGEILSTIILLPLPKCQLLAEEQSRMVFLAIDAICVLSWGLAVIATITVPLCGEAGSLWLLCRITNAVYLWSVVPCICGREHEVIVVCLASYQTPIKYHCLLSKLAVTKNYWLCLFGIEFLTADTQ